MPRRLKPADVHKLRAKNYQFYFEQRKAFLALPDDMRARLAELSRTVEIPPCSLVGADEVVFPIWVHLYKLAVAHGVDYRLAQYIHPWCQDEGWEIYKQMYQALPEPVEFVHIPVDNWPVVHRKGVSVEVR